MLLDRSFSVKKMPHPDLIYGNLSEISSPMAATFVFCSYDDKGDLILQ